MSVAPSLLHWAVELQGVHRRNQVIHLVKCQRPVHVFTIDCKFQTEFVFHFLLPLQGQASRRHDQHAICLTSLTQCIEDHSCFYCLAEPHFIRNQITPARAGNDFVRHADLVREQVCPCIAELAVSIANQ